MSARLILVVDDDPTIRRLVRTGLELEGLRVIEAASLAQARSVTERVDGIVLDRQLPDGDGLAAHGELQARHPGAIVIIHSELEPPDGVLSAPKGDVEELLALFEVVVDDRPPESASALAHEAVHDICAEWLELCRWDPELPVESVPPIRESVVTAVAAALCRPQPLGWGLDPALEPVAEVYMLNAGRLDAAVTQLVSLREAFERQVVARLPLEEQPEAARRLTMIVQRLTTVVVRTGAAELQSQAFTDKLTGLGNRRAFELDLRRELSRARRHDRPLTFVLIDVDGLKQVNDRDGHEAGDDLLRRLGVALATCIRAEDGAYRIGGDEFALLLPDMVVADGEFLAKRLESIGAPACTIGTASAPDDPLEELSAIADRRLYEQRADRTEGLEA